MDVEELATTELSFQKIYLGKSSLLENDLRPGDVIRLNFGHFECICRVFLSKLPTATFAQVNVSVVECSHQKDLLHLYQTYKKCGRDLLNIKQITKANIARTSKFNVKLVLKDSGRQQHENPEILKTVIIDILSTAAFPSNSFICLENHPLAEIYGVHSLAVESSSHPSQDGVFCLDPSCQIDLVEMVSLERLSLLSEGMGVQRVGGVHKAYAMVKSAMEGRSSLLISGPIGAGKTTLVKRVAADLGFPVVQVSCSSLANPSPGETEAALRNVFEKAARLSSEGGAVLLLDDLDTVGSKAGGAGYQARLVAQLLTLLDDVSVGLVVAASTSKPEDLDPALRRPGRLGTEVFLRVPKTVERKAMLECLVEDCEVKLPGDVLDMLAHNSVGFLASDLALLVARVARLDQPVTWEKVRVQLEKTTPSGFKTGLGCVSHEKISWDSVGGLSEVKTKLMRAVEWPLKYPEAFARLGIKPAKGLLLYGPPGCGKTRLVRAAASNTGATFLSVSAAEIFSPWVGDSEKAVVELFRKARMGSPTVLFIDEIDSLVCVRGGEGQQASDRVLSALLTEMDGIGGCESGRVFVVGATNRPNSLDPALTRPGRLDSLLYVPPPDMEGRIAILDTLLLKVPMCDVDVGRLAELTEGYSGADLEGLVKEAVLELLTKQGMEAKQLDMKSVEAALARTSPSVPKNKLNEYTLLQT